MTEQTGLHCETCGPAPLPDGHDPFQVAIAHTEATGHMVTITRTDVIRPEPKT